MAFSMTNTHAATLALLVLTNAGAAAAQPQAPQWQTPPDLNWKWMNEAIFGAPGLQSSATSHQRAFAEAIYAPQLEQKIVSGAGLRAASFVLIGTADDRAATFVFSMFSRAGGPCQDPPNGSAGANEMYAKCPLHVTMISADGRRQTQTFQRYCYLNLDSEDHSRSNYHTEFAFDRRTSTAYFRVIQHGRTVPECSRSLRIARS